MNRTHQVCCKKAKTCQGFSLIELMVSLTIGLVVVVAALSAYTGAASANKMVASQSVMNEDGQAALSILSQQIHMAGYSTAGSFTAIKGCDGSFTNITNDAIAIDALNCTIVDANPDSVAVRYEADKYNTILSTNNKPTDCLGNDLSGTPAYAENRFYLTTPTGRTSKSLYCKGNGSATPQPLVESVEDLQLLYGLAKTAGDKVVAGYVKASAVTNWGLVLTARLCVVIKSEQPVLTDVKSSTFKNCSGTLTNPQDLYLRKAFSTTVVLKRRLL